MGTDTYTEISEKKTSKLGYLILIALFFFLIIIGQTIFSDISKIPERPVGPSYCVNSYLGSMEYIRRKPTCRFNEIDKEFELDTLVNNLDPELNTIIGYNNEISSKQNLIHSNERQLNELLQKYGLSLQETIAEEAAALMDKPEIKNQIISLRTNNDNLRTEINELTITRDEVVQRITPKVDELKNSHYNAQERYKTRIAYYNLKVFLLKLLFVLPFFAISLSYYLKYKKRDSPYTIIATSVFYASTILFLQIVLAFLYQILPRAWFSRIFKVLMSISIMKYIVYYGVTALVILILGGIVYFIQKKIYDPKKVALRHLKESKCPNCSLNLSLSDHFCPNCGRQIKTKCSNCGNLRYSDLIYCPFCGKKE
ncbi:MAG: zinc ribbon domain-containing protein [Candidatus Hydrothermarchaeales archaeon]